MANMQNNMYFLNIISNWDFRILAVLRLIGITSKLKAAATSWEHPSVALTKLIRWFLKIKLFVLQHTGCGSFVFLISLFKRELHTRFVWS